MASDDVMNDASYDDPDGELDSLASSVDSDQDEDKSYYVDTIYTERVFEGQTQYLVKWAEYPAERATWEPVDMFDDEEETLEHWESKKKDIASGKQQPFDLESWERHCAAINEFREDRRQRREKRILGESSSRGLIDPRKQTPEPKTHPLATKATPSTRSQKTSPASKKSGASRPLPKQGLQTSDAPSGQAAKSPYASLTEAADSRNKRRKLETPRQPPQLAPQPAPQQTPRQLPRQPPAPAIQTPKPAPSGFATGGRAAKPGYRSHIFGERTPDVTKLDLIRPSQYPERTGRADMDFTTLPFTTGLNSPPPPERKARRYDPSLPTEDPVKGSSGPRAQTIRDRLGLSRSRRSPDQGDNRPLSVYSRRESPTRPRARSRSPDFSLVAKRPNATAVVENSRITARAPNPAGPRAGAPSSGDLSMESQRAQIPIRIPGPNARKFPNGLWFNPQEALMTMSFGPDKKIIGPTRVCGMPLQFQDLVWNKPPRDRELQVHFEHLCTIDEFGQLIIPPTATERLQPTVVKSTGWIEGFDQSDNKLLQIAEHLRKNDLVALYYPQNGGKFVWVASSRHSRNPQWSSWIRKSSPWDAPSGEPLLVTACENLLPISALKRTRSLPSSSVQEGPQDHLSLEPDEGALDTPTPVGDTVQLTKEFMDFLRGHFAKAKLNPDELAIIEDNGKRSKASTFYLHFPLDNPDAMAEFKCMKAIYAEQGVVTFTNENPNHWASFVNDTKQGVAIFHESFHEYESLQPPITLVTKNSFNLWVVRVARPVELPDPDFTPSGSHVQRIFPNGTGVLLLTEDVMSNLLEVAITLRWIYRCQRGKPRKWKIVFFPGILEWIRKRVNDDKYSKDHDILRLIESLIMKNNLDYPVTQIFNRSSLDFGCLTNQTSAVVALPALDCRTEKHSGIKDKSERDADHLIEILAGVAKVKMARFGTFSTITSERYKMSASKERWEKWGHISINYGFERFYEKYKVNRATMLAEINPSRSAKASS